MPIYEYACEKCGHEFEREQRISDPPIRSCPECRARRVRKLISRTSFVLKGSGWYKDLYSSEKPSTGTEPDKKKKEKKEKKESAADKGSKGAKPAKGTSDSSGSGGSGSKPKAAA